jgi:hypothetical protein
VPTGLGIGAEQIQRRGRRSVLLFSFFQDRATQECAAWLQLSMGVVMGEWRVGVWLVGGEEEGSEVGDQTDDEVVVAASRSGTGGRSQEPASNQENRARR